MPGRTHSALRPALGLADHKTGYDFDRCTCSRAKRGEDRPEAKAKNVAEAVCSARQPIGSPEPSHVPRPAEADNGTDQTLE